MFTMKKYHDSQQCLRGKQLLTSILHSAGISKLWINTEHIFLATKIDRELYVFDVLPEPKSRGPPSTSKKDQTLDTNEATVNVLWKKTEPSLIYVISESGATSFWQFLRPSEEWVRHEKFQLSNAKGATIMDVEFHEETGNIVWCEKRGYGEGTYCVCCRNFTRQCKDGRFRTELGPTQAVLHNCPLIEIFSFIDGICIHPRQPHLEKFYIFWSGRKDVKAVVFKNGQVEDSVNCGSDFRDIAVTLIGSWDTKPDENNLSLLGITVHPTTQDILTLSRNSLVSKITLKSNIVKSIPVCYITVEPDILNNAIRVFANEMKFGLVDESGLIFLYDLTSGKFLYKIEDFSQNSERVWVTHSHSVVPVTIFWNSSDFWKLEWKLSDTLRHVNNTKSEVSQSNVNVISSPNTLPQESIPDSDRIAAKDIAMWQSLYGLEHQAGLFLLDNIVSSLERKDEVPQKEFEILQDLSQNLFQNPAIILALCTNQHISLSESTLTQLKHFLEELDHATLPSSYITPLNTKSEAMFEELLHVMSRLKQMPTVDMNAQLSSIVEQETAIHMKEGLQSVINGVPDTDFLDKVEILNLQQSDYLAKEFLKEFSVSGDVETTDDKLSKIGQLLRDELRERRWKRKRNPENSVVLGTLFQVLYRNHPEILLDVLKLAKTFVGETKNETMLKDTEDCVRDFVLEFLPNVLSEKQCNLTQLQIHAKLLVALGLETDAMGLLLQRKEWEQALGLYIELTRRPGEEHMTSQLYEMLLSAVLRGSGTSERTLMVKIFELKPKFLRLCDFYELCLRNMPENCLEMIFESGFFTVQEAKTALGNFLPNT